MENHPDFPYRVELHDLPYAFEDQAGVYRLRIQTSAGEVCCHFELTAEMTQRGISLPFVKAFALPSLDKAEALAQVFEHLRVVPTPEAYRAFRRRVGERGLAVAGGPLGASPMHLLLHDLMPMDRFLTYLRTAFAELGTGERLILGVSDNVPPGARFERLERVKALATSWGPVAPGGPVKEAP